jgi:predicted GNAT family N-acyltransferase
MEVEFFGVDDRRRVDRALSVRFAVFVDEQGVPVEEEVDDHDRTDGAARHALVTHGDRDIATGRYFVLDPQSVKIGRMAVLAEQRGCGVGRRLLVDLLADARSRGFLRAYLHAQEYAVDFYLKAGFKPLGETTVECGIIHQPMERVL